MITPYLVFNGECQNAMDFYRSVFPCGEPKIMNYGDYMPEGSKTPPELLRTWVMHGEMTICGTKCMVCRRSRAVYQRRQHKAFRNRADRQRSGGYLRCA